jgi:nanoRNase/pAp phosphatase (c-di-AMP/oligoRNAs hydrolase)
MLFYDKYLKYKNKYLELKNIIGGSHINEQIFLKTNDTIKQGKIIEDISPNYVVEIEEKGNIIQKVIPKIIYDDKLKEDKEAEYKLVAISTIIDLDKNIDYSKDKFVVYYHGQNCNDGITSAWVTNEFLKSRGVNIENIKYIDLPASKETQDKYNKFNDNKSIILFVDVAPSIETYYKLKKNNKRIIIIDHHITNLVMYYPLLKLGADIIFDMNTSGTGLTWTTFFKKEFPQFIELVIRRDIFKQIEGDNTESFYEIYNELLWGMPAPTDKNGIKEMSIKAAMKFDDIQAKIDRKEIVDNYFILEHPVQEKPKGAREDKREKLFERYKLIDKIYTDKAFFDKCIEEGKKITEKSERQYLTDAYRYIINNDVYLYKNEDDGKTYRVCLIYDYKGDVNSLSNVLCNNNFCHFVIMWYYKNEYAIDNKKNIACSLRAWYKFDVSKLAQKYGGGGHMNASGGVYIDKHPTVFFNLVKINKNI